MLSRIQPDSASTGDALRALDQLSSRVDNTDCHDGGYLATTGAVSSPVHQDTFGRSTPSGTLTSWILGSHQPHVSMLMTLMGYHVHGVDLPLFAARPSVVRRAAEFAITNRSDVMNAVGKPIKIPYDTNSVDVVICTETLEHLTFNPVRFWSEVYRAIKSAGLICITTPNSLSLTSTLSQLKLLLLRRCIGLGGQVYFALGHQRSPLEGIGPV